MGYGGGAEGREATCSDAQPHAGGQKAGNRMEKMSSLLIKAGGAMRQIHTSWHSLSGAEQDCGALGALRISYAKGLPIP